MAGTRGYFIMKNGKLADCGYEMEGTDGLGGGVDHYGYGLALDNRKLFGIPDDLAQKALGYGEGSAAAMEDFDVYNKVWDHIKNAILARVCTMVETSNTHRPDITIQFLKKVSPKMALKTVQLWMGKQIPDAPEDSQVTIDIDSDIYMQADNVREFMSAEDPRQLMNR